MDVWSQIQSTPLLEWLAVVFAIAYVVLAARQNILCWPSAFISTAIYTYLFWQVMLPFQSFLNAFYMLMAIYGVWHWKKAQRADSSFAVLRMPTFAHLVYTPIALAIALGLAQLAEKQFSSEYLLLDAFINVISMMTTVLVAKKYIDNWLYWVLINSLSAWLYWQSGMFLSGILFGSYVGFAIYGYIEWQRASVAASPSRVSD